MRKEVIYSLAALTAMPLAANAVVVNVPDPIKNTTTDWVSTAATPSISGTSVVVSAGAKISQDLGTLVPGKKYVLKIQHLVSTDSDLKIAIAGKNFTVTKASTAFEETFAIDTEQNVTIEISSVDDLSFEVDNVTLTFDYDFGKAADVFGNVLTPVISKIDSYDAANVPNKSTYLADAAVIKAKVDEIRNATAANGYAIYKKYKLDADNSAFTFTGNSLFDEIYSLASKAAYDNQVALGNALTTKLAGIVADAADATAKGVTDDYDAIVKAIQKYKDDAKAASDDKKAHEFDIDDATYNEIDQAIDKLESKILAADQLASLNLEAYTYIKTYVQGGEIKAGDLADDTYVGKYVAKSATYTQENNKLQEKLAGDRYANILAAAQKALSTEFQKIKTVLTENEANKTKAAGAEGGYVNADMTLNTTNINALIARIDAAVAAMTDEADGPVAKYVPLKTTLDTRDGEWSAKVTALNVKIEDYKNVKEVTAVANAITEATNAVQAIKTAIDAALVTTEEGDISVTLTDLDNTTLISTAQSKIDNIGTVGTPYKTRYDNTQTINDKTTNASKDGSVAKVWAAQQAKIANYKYGTELISSYFEATIAEIEADITALTTEKDAAIASGATDITKDATTAFINGTDPYNKSLADKCNAIIEKINKYEEQTKQAQTAYNDYTSKINTYKSNLATVKAKFENLPVFNNVNYNYKAKCDSITKQITAMENDIAAAKAKKDYANTDAMKALADDKVVSYADEKGLKDNGDGTYTVTDVVRVNGKNIADAISALDSNYSDDNDLVNDAAKAAVVDAISASYNKLIDDLAGIDSDADKYGKSYTAIDEARKNIQKEMNADPLWGYTDASKTTAKKAIATASADELTEIRATIAAISTKLENLVAMAEQAAAKVTANNTAKNLADAATLTGKGDGNLQDYYTAKIDDTTLDDNGVAKGAAKRNETALTDNNVSIVKKLNDAANKAGSFKYVTAEINDLITAISDDRDAEVLDETWESTHKAKVQSIKEEIDQLVKDADAAGANLAKYNELKTKIGNYEATHTGTQKKLDDAIAEAKGEDAAINFATAAVVEEQQAKINGRKTANDNNYKNTTCVTNEKAITDILAEVEDFASKLKQRAIDNLKNYNLEKTEYDKVNTQYETVSANLALNDESSKLKEYQAQLTEQLNELKKLSYDTSDADNLGEIASEYLAVNLTATEHTDNMAKLAAIYKAIGDIEAAQQEGYVAQITTDNDNMFEAIKLKVQEAQKAYEHAVNTIEPYKDLQSDLLNDVKTTVQEYYDDLNGSIYTYGTDEDGEDLTFAQVITQKFNDAKAAYEATKSPVVFDKDSLIINDIKADIKKLQGYEDKFVTNIKTLINAKVDLDTWQTPINNAVSALEALRDWDNKEVFNNTDAKNAVDDVQKIVNDIEKAKGAIDIKTLDEKIAQLSSINAMLNTDKYNAVQPKLLSDIEAKEAEFKAGQTWLNENGHSDQLDAYTTEYNNSVKKARQSYTSNVKANKASTIISNYSTIENYLSQFKGNVVESLKANDTNMPLIEEAVGDAQALIDAAVAAISDYAIAGDIQKNSLNTLQDQINAILNQAKTDYKTPGSLTDDYVNDETTGVKALLKAITDQLPAIVGTEGKVAGATTELFDAEKDYLNKKSLPALEAAYNKVVAGVDLTDEAAVKQSEDFKARIEAVKEDLSTAEATSKASELLKVQNTIAQLITELNTVNYGDQANAEAETEISEQLSALKDIFKASDYADYDDAIEGQEEEIAQLNAAIKAIDDEIAAKKADGQLAYYKDKILKDIEAAKVNANNVKTAVGANQTTINGLKSTFNSGYTALNTQINILKAKITASKNKLDGSNDIFQLAENVSSEAFANMYKQLEDDVEALRSDVAAEQQKGYKDGKAASTFNTRLTDVQKNVQENIYDIENTAALRELDAQKADLQKQLDAINPNLNLFTLKDQNEIETQKNAIKDKIGVFDKTTETYTTGSLADGIQNARDGIDFNTSGKEDLLIQYLADNGKDQGGLVDTIQGLIDTLNKYIYDHQVVAAGDANRDGKVDVSDYDFVIENLGIDEPAASADVNGDGVVNIADLDYIIERIM